EAAEGDEAAVGADHRRVGESVAGIRAGGIDADQGGHAGRQVANKHIWVAVPVADSSGYQVCGATGEHLQGAVGTEDTRVVVIRYGKIVTGGAARAVDAGENRGAE